MSIKTLALPLLFAAIPLTVNAGPGSASIGAVGEYVHGSSYNYYHPGFRGGLMGYRANFVDRNFCAAYNRDGTTCYEVGFMEGQAGAPWRGVPDYFRCVNGCLQWIGRGPAWW